MRHELDRVFQKRVGVGRCPLLLGFAVRRSFGLLEQLVAQLRLTLSSPGVGELRDLPLVNVRALQPLDLPAERREQHVSLPKQRFGPVLIEDHPRVGLA